MGDLSRELVSVLSQSSIPDLDSVDHLLAAHLGELEKESVDDGLESSVAQVDEAMESQPWLEALEIDAFDLEYFASGHDTDEIHTPPLWHTHPIAHSQFWQSLEAAIGTTPSHYGIQAEYVTLTPSLIDNSFGSGIQFSPSPSNFIAFTTPAAHGDIPVVPENSHKRTFREFLHDWRIYRLPNPPTPVACHCSEGQCVGGCISPGIALSEIRADRDDSYDNQGIDWVKLNTTRRNARQVRPRIMSAHLHDADRGEFNERQRRASQERPDDTERFFKFRKLSRKHKPFVNHYQLLNMIASTSANDVYYATQSDRRAKIMRTDTSEKATCVMELSNGPLGRFSTTCLSASKDVLVAGSFEGSYAYTYLDTHIGSKHVMGQVTATHNGITNHAHTFPDRRNTSTQAAFCSNDSTLRTLDCATNRFTNVFTYDFLINCAATSPDGQMRLIVGDATGGPAECVAKSYITRTDNGRPIKALLHHKDADAFACAWADDGITFATAAQDHYVLVYDARRWDMPMARIQSKMSVPRVLCFSPIGSGRRTLFIAEADDFVSIVDARTWKNAQVLDSFGALGGMSLTPDGQSLFVANVDSTVGGLMEYQRCDVGDQWGVRGDEMWDWMGEDDVGSHRSTVRNWRQRRNVGMDCDIVV
ncbi:WD40 repeat-like protein [Pseudovirgaria hyperparasitica]|uniref:WD40 repeat-like protein n=1 Tax=Pseudovirgaria hyperparasitica TaxID=470096 RepID=A0A6A6VWZ3_9PEZI|nr:WD40 repeat-like protein [Pseudovirgaria hyperparasitica]KAF2754160.1 WD40 repeat-like protein [Pseudovirgaria hyperparasitica]